MHTSFLNKCKAAVLAIAATALFSVTTNNATAQSSSDPSLAVNTPAYRTAIGLRGGTTSGITIKHFMSSNSAYEGILGFWGNGLSGTFLYERHVNAFDVSGMNWYYGGGGHVALSTRDVIVYNYPERRYYTEEGVLGLGVDGILGLEYKIPPIPFAISFDVKPFVEVTTAGQVGVALDPGLGIKVAF